MRKMVTSLAVGLALVLGAWFAFTAAAAPRPPAAPSRPKVAIHRVSRRVATATSMVGAGSAASATSGGRVTDATASETENEVTGLDGQRENASESEQENGAPNEADGHEDPNGQDINHECPPNCDSANGEQP
jgi:hypothetical protein